MTGASTPNNGDRYPAAGADPYATGRAAGATSPPGADRHETAHTATGRPVDPADLSLGDTVSAVTEGMSDLIRGELALAKAELTVSAKNAGKGAGMFAGAGVAGHLALIFLSLALAWLIGTWIGLGWGALIVGVLWAIVAAVLAVRGKKEITNVGMPQTTETAARIPDALKGEEAP